MLVVINLQTLLTMQVHLRGALDRIYLVMRQTFGLLCANHVVNFAPLEHPLRYVAVGSRTHLKYFINLTRKVLKFVPE